jgi:hypothetical protein
MPAEERYSEGHRSHDAAHLVIDGTGPADMFTVIEDRRAA